MRDVRRRHNGTRFAIVAASRRHYAVQTFKVFTWPEPQPCREHEPQKILDSTCPAMHQSCIYLRLLAHINGYNSSSMTTRAVSARCKARTNAHGIYVVVLRRVRTESAQQFPIPRAMRVQYSTLSAWTLLERAWLSRLEPCIRERRASRPSVTNCASTTFIARPM